MKLHRNFFLLVIGCGVLGAMGCGGGSSSNRSPVNAIASPGTNVASITVNAGPTGNYVDGAFTSVTVCVPGSSTCQTVDGILVDTGSSGLRILSSQVTLPLVQQNAPDGNPLVECFPFVSGYTWGGVYVADVEIAGEKGSSTPIELIGGTSYPVPAACTNMIATSSDTLETLGAYGILGVGQAPQDCGAGCPPSLYYGCTSSGCVGFSPTLAQQVPNPVTLFAADNNGVIMELPAVTAPEATSSGSLVFGIGTQANNALGAATVYTANTNPNDYGTFTTVYEGNAYSQSFIDSGSNGYFFLDNPTTGLPYCDVNSNQPQGDGFYCPATTANLSATNQGVNGASGTVSFSVGNANSLFADSNDTVFNDLGGPFPGSFDWGLPFFFGRNVYVAIGGMSTPGGVGPYWAY